MHPIHRPSPPVLGPAFGTGTAALLLAAAWSLGGCASADHPDGTRRDRPLATGPALEAVPKVSIFAPELRPFLDFGPPVLAGGGDRPLEVGIAMRNDGPRKYLVEYRYRFFAHDGFEERPAADWSFCSIEPGEEVKLPGISLGSGAVDYRLEVRWSR